MRRKASLTGKFIFRGIYVAGFYAVKSYGSYVLSFTKLVRREQETEVLSLSKLKVRYKIRHQGTLVLMPDAATDSHFRFIGEPAIVTGSGYEIMAEGKTVVLVEGDFGVTMVIGWLEKAPEMTIFTDQRERRRVLPQESYLYATS